MNNFEKVREFQTTFNQDLKDKPYTREKLIREEVEEVLDELYKPNWAFSREKLAKEIADLLYVTYGLAVDHGIDCIDEVFARVHTSNMSKAVNGKAEFREDGKILKGPNYEPPNLEDLFKEGA